MPEFFTESSDMLCHRPDSLCKQLCGVFGQHHVIEVTKDSDLSQAKSFSYDENSASQINFICSRKKTVFVVNFVPMKAFLLMCLLFQEQPISQILNNQSGYISRNIK